MGIWPDHWQNRNGTGRLQTAGSAGRISWLANTAACHFAFILSGIIFTSTHMAIKGISEALPPFGPYLAIAGWIALCGAANHAILFADYLGAHMLVVGLTGGIGSGKSTVANLFAERGAAIIDADIIAREVTEKESPALKNIVKHFGPEVILKDGSLDRGKLRQLVFNHPNDRLWLEKLLHPLIKDEMTRQIARMKAAYCVAVIPLLLEVEFYSFINRILVIDTSETEQIKRAMLRDNISKSEVEAILHSQASRQARRAKAHDVILNDGSLEDLIPQVDKLHEKYLEMSQHSVK